MLAYLRIATAAFLAMLAISSGTVAPAMAATDYYLELDSFNP